MSDDLPFTPGVVSIGADPDGRWISIGVVTIEDVQSETAALPSTLALQDIPGLAQLIHTLQTHLIGMIEAAREPEPDAD